MKRYLGFVDTVFGGHNALVSKVHMRDAINALALVAQAVLGLLLLWTFVKGETS